MEKLLKDERVTLDNLKLGRKEVAVRSLQKKINYRETKKSTVKVLEYSQRLKYLEIRTNRRKVEARRSYRLAFKADKPWPDSNEYKKYVTHKRLRSAPRNWNYRVPKLFKDTPNYKTK